VAPALDRGDAALRALGDSLLWLILSLIATLALPVITAFVIGVSAQSLIAGLLLPVVGTGIAMSAAIDLGFVGSGRITLTACVISLALLIHSTASTAVELAKNEEPLAHTYVPVFVVAIMWAFLVKTAACYLNTRLCHDQCEKHLREWCPGLLGVEIEGAQQ